MGLRLGAEARVLLWLSIQGWCGTRGPGCQAAGLTATACWLLTQGQPAVLPGSGEVLECQDGGGVLQAPT